MVTVPRRSLEKNFGRERQEVLESDEPDLPSATEDGSTPPAYYTFPAERLPLDRAERFPEADASDELQKLLGNRPAAGGIGQNVDVPLELKFAAGGGIGAPNHRPSGAGAIGSRGPSIIPDQPFHSGLIPGNTGGRTDRIPLSLGSDSHVIPADAVSGIGGGGSQNGSEKWAASIRGAPWGVPVPKAVRGRGPPAPPRAPTGMAGGGNPQANTSILAASEEIVVAPEDVEALGERGIRDGRGEPGETAMDVGHRLIDEAIAAARKFVVEFTRNAPEPKK